MDASERFSKTKIPVKKVKWHMEVDRDDLDLVDQLGVVSLQMEVAETILVLAFERSKTSSLFTKQHIHTDVEMFLVPTPAPIAVESGHNPKSYEFVKSGVLAININKSNGVQCDLKRIRCISSDTHDTLCIPLTHSEKLNIVNFVYTIKQCKYNTWDAFLSQTLPRLAPFLARDDLCEDHTLNFGYTIKRLHPGQLVTLIIQKCLDQKQFKCKMWGYNSRFTSPHEIYNEIGGTCLTINPNAFRNGYIQAWGIGVSRTGPNMV
jgi:hypothetical protein